MVNRGAAPTPEGQRVRARMHIPAEPAERSRPGMSTGRITAAALQIVHTEGSAASRPPSPKPRAHDSG